MKTCRYPEPDLTPIWITIYYDTALQRITGKTKELSMVNNGCPFAFVLQSILISYAEIEKKYPPGVLGFTLNGQPPDPSTSLKDGDLLCFEVYEDNHEKACLQ